MLLGIVLHAALAYAMVPQWFAQDPQQSEVAAMGVHIIHGFRMPLFFLLSGYFTMMLLARRGTRSTLAHRGKRILLPLIIGTLTVVPLTWGVVIGANVIKQLTSPPAVETTGEAVNLWDASARGSADEVSAFLDLGISPDEPDPAIRTLPLAWAAAHGNIDTLQSLLDAGADLDARNGDGSTPLHTAAFFGEAEIARRLLDAGADPEAKTYDGQTPMDSTAHGPEVVNYIAGLLQVESDFMAVSTGREQVRAMLQERGAGEGPSPLTQLLNLALLFPLFFHLWFLWFLCWLVLGLIVCVFIAQRLGLGRFSGAWLAGPMGVGLAIALTCLPQLLMRNQGEVTGFGPDTSAGLIPMPHVLVYYAVFFGFGAVLYAVAGGIDRIGRTWWAWLLIALAAGVPALGLGRKAEWMTGLIENQSARHAMSVVLEPIFTWSMSLALLGVFRTLLSGERFWVRYMSDASYWLYITHLPLVIAGQFLLVGVDLPWFIELALLVFVPTAVLLGCYQLFVRYTPIGTKLNGKRSRN